METPDVIVVGAGVCGSSAAIRMAQKGLKVVLIDRSMPIGSKSLSGGVLWGNDLAEILPNWKEEAPYERKVLNKKVGFLSEEDATVLDFHFSSWDDEGSPGVSVLRVKFDAWLAEQAEAAGVSVLQGITIDSLIFENGKVVGVRQGNDELKASAVLIAEGANPRLLLKHGLTYKKEENARFERHDAMIGIKEVISIGKEKLEERFMLNEKSGLAGEFVLGNNPDGILAGGFFYTNVDSVSLGVVVHLDTLTTGNTSYEVMERYKQHPFVQRLIKDGISMEYGAKLIPEYGIDKLPQLFGDGFLVAGDAAGFVFSNGLVIQGMNYAIKSGLLAADTLIEAKSKGDFSAATLKAYRSRLDKSFIIKDFKKFKKVHKMTKNPRLFSTYPKGINEAFKSVLDDAGRPKENIIKVVLKTMKKSGAGLFTLAKDGLGARHL